MLYLKFIQGEAERVELAQSTEGNEKGGGDLPAASSSLEELGLPVLGTLTAGWAAALGQALPPSQRSGVLRKNSIYTST